MRRLILAACGLALFAISALLASATPLVLERTAGVPGGLAALLGFAVAAVGGLTVGAALFFGSLNR